MWLLKAYSMWSRLYAVVTLYTFSKDPTFITPIIALPASPMNITEAWKTSVQITARIPPFKDKYQISTKLQNLFACTFSSKFDMELLLSTGNKNKGLYHFFPNKIIVISKVNIFFLPFNEIIIVTKVV